MSGILTSALKFDPVAAAITAAKQMALSYSSAVRIHGSSEQMPACCGRPEGQSILGLYFQNCVANFFAKVCHTASLY